MLLSDWLFASDEGGCRRGNLVNWYLGEVEGEIESVEELTERKLLVEKVIERLITHVSVGGRAKSDDEVNGDSGEFIIALECRKMWDGFVGVRYITSWSWLTYRTHGVLSGLVSLPLAVSC